MNKYNDSKIYKIVDNTSDKVYIGSTCHKYLSQRLQKHLQNYRRYERGLERYVTSYSILKNNDYDIILIENVNCETVDQLKARERYHIENTPNCVNRNVPTRSDKEWHQQMYNKNKETILEERKQYYEENKEQIRERVNAYYHNNKEKRNEKHREWSKQTFECECGSTVRISGKSSHCKTKKHLNFISNK
jgi:hypothetical protein